MLNCRRQFACIPYLSYKFQRCQHAILKLQIIWCSSSPMSGVNENLCRAIQLLKAKGKIQIATPIQILSDAADEASAPAAPLSPAVTRVQASIVRLLCARAYTRITCIAHRETCMDRRGKKGTKSLANLSQGSSSSALALPCFQVPVACMSQRTHTAKLPAIGGRKDVVGRPGCLAGYGGKGKARL